MKRKIAVTAVTLVLITGIVLYLIYYNRGRFYGYLETNANFYISDFEIMNGSDYHTLELEKGDTLLVHFETEKGSLNMEIDAPDGIEVYSGNGKDVTDFTVNIPESGTYSVNIKANHARGKIYIQKSEEVNERASEYSENV